MHTVLLVLITPLVNWVLFGLAALIAAAGARAISALRPLLSFSRKARPSKLLSPPVLRLPWDRSKPE
jgi:hypothetical protein